MKEASTIAKSAAGEKDDALAAWALKLIENRDTWSERQRRRRTATFFPI